MVFVLFQIYLVDEDVHHSCRIPPPLDALERSLAVLGDSVALPFFNCRVSARLTFAREAAWISASRWCCRLGVALPIFLLRPLSNT